MEAITIFAVSVGFICGCHIMFSAAEVLGIGRYSVGKSPAKRDDWYCFFKMEDLVGKEPNQQQVDNRRRQQQPRMHV